MSMGHSWGRLRTSVGAELDIICFEIALVLCAAVIALRDIPLRRLVASIRVRENAQLMLPGGCVQPNATREKKSQLKS